MYLCAPGTKVNSSRRYTKGSGLGLLCVMLSLKSGWKKEGWSRGRTYRRCSTAKGHHHFRVQKHIELVLPACEKPFVAREKPSSLGRDMTKTTINTIYISFACFYMNHLAIFCVQFGNFLIAWCFRAQHVYILVHYFSKCFAAST